MGYYTNYSLDLYNCTDEECEQFGNELYEATGHDSDAKELVNEGYLYDIKNFSMLDALIDISRNYPNMLIILGGDGEAQDDIWERRIKNGEVLEREMQMCPPIDDYPKFMTASEIDCRNRLKATMEKETERTRKFIEYCKEHNLNN